MTDQERDDLLLGLKAGQKSLQAGQKSLQEDVSGLREGQQSTADMLMTQFEVNRNIEKHLRRLSGDDGLYIVQRREAHSG